MAYIDANKTRAIKAKLKKAYPDFKFSVRNRNYSSVDVTIAAGPVRFNLTDEAKRRAMYDWKDDADYVSINPYYPESYEHADILKGMLKIINDGNHDNSDPMTDYFDVGWYVNLSAGAWNKPYVFTG